MKALLLAVPLLISSGPVAAQTAAADEKAAVELEKLRVELLKSQIPPPPSKDLMPSAPPAPSLDATANKHTYAIARSVARRVVEEAGALLTGQTLAIDDGRTRSGVGVYKSVLASVGYSTDAIVERTKALGDARNAVEKPKPAPDREFSATAVGLLPVIMGLQTAIGMAQLFKTQYSFESTTQQSFADAVLMAALVEHLVGNKHKVLDVAQLVMPCIPRDLSSTWQTNVGNELLCASNSASALAALLAKLHEALDAARIASSDAGKSIEGKDDKNADIKLVATRITELNSSVSAANSMLSVLATADANGVSALDVAQRIEPLFKEMNAKKVHFISIKSIAANSDIIVDTRWYSPLEVSMESVVLAQWQLSNSFGETVAKKLTCTSTGRAKISLRVDNPGAPRVGHLPPAVTCD